MAEVKFKDRSGADHTTTNTGGPRQLMEVLRDLKEAGVAGTCGGMCSCGTCHVYVSENWVEKLPPRTQDEDLMLEAIGELVTVKPNSRLSCQIMLDESLSGIEIEIAPEV